MPAFLIPILISAGLGLLGGVASGVQASGQQQTERETARQQRERVNQFIAQMQGTDAVTDAANNAMHSIGAGAAQRGVFGSGSHTVSVGRAVGDIAAQREAQEQQIIAQLMQDPAFDVSNAPVDWFGNIALNAIGGAVGGAGSAVGATLSTPAGQESWGIGAAGGETPSPSMLAQAMSTDPSVANMSSAPSAMAMHAPSVTTGGTAGAGGGGHMQQGGFTSQGAGQVPVTPVGSTSTNDFLSPFGLVGDTFSNTRNGGRPSQDQLMQFMAMMSGNNFRRG